jgi:hypothetical protein
MYSIERSTVQEPQKFAASSTSVRSFTSSQAIKPQNLLFNQEPRPEEKLNKMLVEFVDRCGVSADERQN